MMHTVKFRIYPDETKECKLNEIFTIFNRVKRIGYKLLFCGEDYITERFNEEKSIQQCLMSVCHNNPYVNAILTGNKATLEAQKTWLEKRRKFMTLQLKIINRKLNKIKDRNTHDRRLNGLYARRASLMAKLQNLRLEPVVFGGKKLFRDRIRGKISKKEFRIRRDSSFSCAGVKQKGVRNWNIKILKDKTVKIRTFSKQNGRKWLILPVSVNNVQEKWFQQILNADKYTVTVKRKLFKGKVRYFVHVSYDISEPAPSIGYENGAIGLDFNYNFVALPMLISTANSSLIIKSRLVTSTVIEPTNVTITSPIRWIKSSITVSIKVKALWLKIYNSTKNFPIIKNSTLN